MVRAVALIDIVIVIAFILETKERNETEEGKVEQISRSTSLEPRKDLDERCSLFHAIAR